MFRQIVAFELRYQLRQPLLWAIAAMFCVLSFIATITDALAIGGAIGSLNRNAPYVVVRMLGDLSVVGAFIVVAFVATSVLRDFERGTGRTGLLAARSSSATCSSAGSWARCRRVRSVLRVRGASACSSAASCPGSSRSASGPLDRDGRTSTACAVLALANLHRPRRRVLRVGEPSPAASSPVYVALVGAPGRLLRRQRHVRRPREPADGGARSTRSG